MCSKWPSRRICWTQKIYCASVFVCLFIRLSFKTKKRKCGESNNVELYLASKPEQQPPLLAGNPQLFGGNKQTPSLKGMRSTTTMLTKGAKNNNNRGYKDEKKTAGKVSCFKRESKVRAFLFSNYERGGATGVFMWIKAVEYLINVKVAEVALEILFVFKRRYLMK